jgi:hypothetical protein
MRINLLHSVTVALLIALSSDVFGQDSEIQELKSELEALRSEYDARIAALESRLALAEQSASAASYVAEQQSVSDASGAAAFNPAIGVIFSGSAWNYSRDPDAYAVQGFPYGGEAGPIAEGLALGETEIIMNANVDDKFSAWLTAALAIEDGEAVVELEEAWVEATALPGGLGARFGRFYSGIGYLNSKHAHAWDFADQPLPYQAFLAGQMKDDGLQVRWLAPTDVYLELGAEAFQGGSYPASGAADSGWGSYSLFAKAGGDIGASSSWLAGVSWLDATAVERPSGDEDDPYLFSGDSNLLVAEFVWKWAPGGNWRERNFIFQAEYLARSEDGQYEGAGLGPTPYANDQRGWYAQAVYQPRPRWRIGGRIDALSSDDPGLAYDGTQLAAPGSDPRRFSLMADWANSEFSRFRLQMTRDEAGLVDDNQWGLQYIHSIGAHGAHTF